MLQRLAAGTNPAEPPAGMTCEATRPSQFTVTCTDARRSFAIVTLGSVGRTESPWASAPVPGADEAERAGAPVLVVESKGLAGSVEGPREDDGGADVLVVELKGLGGSRA